MVLVTGTKEARGSAEQAFAALVPADALAGFERFGNLRFVEERRRDQTADRSHEHRAVLIAEIHILYRRHREFARSCIVFDIAGRSLRREPFADIALAGTGGLRKFQ